MEIPNSLLLSLIFLGMIYCIPSLQTLQGKINKKSSMIAYRQTEAFIQLNNLLDFEAAIPATLNWAALPDLLLTISEIVKKVRSKAIISPR